MAAPTRPPANTFVAKARKVYNPIGFSKGYNFILWFIFAGAMFGFALARMMFLNYNGIYCNPNSAGNGAGPGECWSYNRKDLYKIGIKMHLYTIIPASFLVVFQFVPFIRYKALLFHRMNGYIVVVLAIIGTVGAIIIAPVAFGGSLSVRAAVGLMSIMFLWSLFLAIWNIKTLQLEQHRAWMLRAWFYAGSIITLRIIMIISALIMSKTPSFRLPMQCAKVASFYDDTESLIAKYPACQDLNAWVAIQGDMSGESTENIASALSLGFSMGIWLALAIHAIGIEVYLHLTPAETERLRRISFQRQQERGFKNPGSSGLTSDRLGDAETWRAGTDATAYSPSKGSDSDISNVAAA
ncbi:hypothetical protein AU210_012683 [Fusarium oxysporum f. sp. radicis-cucumerinum]|uniref:Microtubule associated protein n=2 Tax=Fusarium oxysporum TaxID=5507 RepID=A0A2H3GPM4_FUSOX|nr:hypothetical protein FOZG_16663 [Fusarium oxysporum Fo47]PCD26252.1 hypothetical protein AU210_012683 [Fusarium oxysporum f. sp. radicis-cucumerinum]